MKLRETQATHTEPTTMFNETELASPGRSACALFKTGAGAKPFRLSSSCKAGPFDIPLQAMLDSEEASLRIVS